MTGIDDVRIKHGAINQAKPDREEHEQHRHAAEGDVHGVAQRGSAGCQHLALVHRRKWPEQPKGCVGQYQAAHDSHDAISTGRSPDTQSEGGDQHGVDRAERHPERPCRSPNRGQLAGDLRNEAVPFVLIAPIIAP